MSVTFLFSMCLKFNFHVLPGESNSPGLNSHERLIKTIYLKLKSETNIQNIYVISSC